MSGNIPTPSPKEFIEVARREGLLEADSADDLSRESDHRQISPAQLAMQKGLLSPVQVEIVETLLNPEQAVAGYEILGLLGYGGMGVVYRARQKSLGRIVALKTLMLNVQGNTSRLNRFEQEAQTVGRLVHPHIIAAYDFGRDGGRLYFAMELVEGEDVERRLNRDGHFCEIETWGIIRQAASGLAHAAELDVVHRDIKPANLMLVPPPRGFPLPAGMPMVKIADFGLARITNDAESRTRLTADNSTVGSPHYMAPEQLGTHEVDFRADMYSLGATAYHMLSGQPPFDGLTLPQIFAQKLNDMPTQLSELRPGLSLETMILVQELMSRDRTQRPGQYAELIARIDQLGLPIGTPIASSPGGPRKGAEPTLRVSTDTRHGESETQSITPSVITHFPATRSLRQRMPRYGWPIVAAALLIGAIGVGFAMWKRPPAPANGRPEVELATSGYALDLFDGQSLSRWQTQAGNWQTATDDEGATVLAASHGLITRTLAKEVSGQPAKRLEYYRLRFNVALRQATAIELSFGIHTPAPNAEARSVLRLDHETVTLGQQASQSAAVVPATSPAIISISPDRYYEVRVERQATKWLAFFQGQLIGSVPLAENEAPLFRVAVESNSDEHLAYLADFLVEELASP